MKRLKRVSHIIRIIIRYRLDELLDRDNIPASLAFLLTFSPSRLKPVPKLSRGERIRLSLEELGPIFIKFGQMLSTRRDLLPDDIINELEKLQDQVPHFPSQQAINIIERSLGESLSNLFAEFSTEPLASASVAQVHSAKLHSGQDVVVKVIRPTIEKIIRQDIQLLFTFARWIEKYLPDGKRLRPVDIVDDYQHTILDELDLQREGANGSQLRRNFQNSDLLYVPEVYWDYTRKNVLTMERIDGIPVSNIEALKAQQIDMQILAERGVEIFFTQLLRDSFFHADMHPGNIFVSRDNPQTPQYIAIDCAIIGTLSESDQYYLARNLLAIFQRDYKLVAELHVECGWVPADTRVNDFEAAIRSVCEPIFEKPIAEISFGKLLVYLFQTARRFNMEVQPSLVLLQKTMLHIEGLGRQLYPQLDLWNTAKPQLEQWLKDRYSAKGVYKRLSRKMPGLLEQLPQLPEAILENLQQTKQLESISEQQQYKIKHLQQQLSSQYRQKRITSFSLILLIAALIPANPQLFQQAQNMPFTSWVLLAVAALLWLRR